MKNEVLAERLRFFKETEEGQEELSEVDARSVARGEIRGEAKGLANFPSLLNSYSLIRCLWSFLLQRQAYL